eukprot:1433382-Rhodomonas_salina.1
MPEASDDVAAEGAVDGILGYTSNDKHWSQRKSREVLQRLQSKRLTSLQSRFQPHKCCEVWQTQVDQSMDVSREGSTAVSGELRRELCNQVNDVAVVLAAVAVVFK